jgi:two-component system phosphate regulon response regulator PhoB
MSVNAGEASMVQMVGQVLVVDDEPDIGALVAYHLAKCGCRVSTSGLAREALQLALRDRPDVVVLDVMLPDGDGFELLQELRARPETSGTGIILLTARTTRDDRVKGLALGADDYIVKPFSTRELVLRVRALLQRLQAQTVDRAYLIQAGPISIDPVAHVVRVDKETVSLTAMEFRLLLGLIERKGRVQSRRQLLQDVWLAQPDIRTRTVDNHVQRLRAKLGPAGELIETIQGVGYRFRAAHNSH